MVENNNKPADHEEDQPHFEPISKANKRLIIDAQKGDADAIAKVIELYYKDILYFSKKKLGTHDGEDVAQQVTLRIVDKIKDLNDPLKFKSWMMSTVYHECIEFMRRRKAKGDQVREVELSEEALQMIDNGEAAFDELFIGKETSNQILQILDTIPENYADCIRLRYLEELSYKEIAEVLKVNEKKVKNDLHRGLKVLERRIEEAGGRSAFFSVGATGAIPALTQALQGEQALLTSPDASLQVAAYAKEYALAQNAGLAGGGSAGTSASKPLSLAAKIVFSSVALVVAVVIGASILVSNLTPANTPASTQQQAQNASPEADFPQESQREIQTVADMIGAEEAQQLKNFETQNPEASSWEAFLHHIGAHEEEQALEYDYSYKLYVVEEQNKQLILAERKSLEDGSIKVLSLFGQTQELPRMVKVILMFD